MDQMETYFCGNILQVNSVGGTPLIVMSQRAFSGFATDYITRLETHADLFCLGPAFRTVQKTYL